MPEDTHARTDTVRTQMRMKPVRLTDTKSKQLQPPVRGNTVVYDEQLPGFGIRVTAGGTKSFILNYRAKGRERRITIGRLIWRLIASYEAVTLLS